MLALSKSPSMKATCAAILPAGSCRVPSPVQVPPATQSTVASKVSTPKPTGPTWMRRLSSTSPRPSSRRSTPAPVKPPNSAGSPTSNGIRIPPPARLLPRASPPAVSSTGRPDATGKPSTSAWKDSRGNSKIRSPGRSPARSRWMRPWNSSISAESLRASTRAVPIVSRRRRSGSSTSCDPASGTISRPLSEMAPRVTTSRLLAPVPRKKQPCRARTSKLPKPIVVQERLPPPGRSARPGTPVGAVEPKPTTSTPSSSECAITPPPSAVAPRAMLLLRPTRVERVTAGSRAAAGLGTSSGIVVRRCTAPDSM
ncbi:unannotated protein [freshwater metagenome]|uniref:Unannotated protein n=1 Tax=freshwater metagenome TaxID=449393 RepID=A0A6J6QFS7_9ZZZZ